MTCRTCAGLALTAALTLLAVTVHPQDAVRAPLADARLDHVVIAARDADRTAAQFATLLGVLPPQSRVVLFNVPGQSSARLKTVSLQTNEFRIEIRQPLDAKGPTHQFVNRYGPGIEHIGFAVDSGMAERVRDMERRGGKLMLGTPTGPHATVMFGDAGFSIDLVQEARPYFAAGALPPSALAARQVSHVGLVYVDAQPAIATLAALLGIQAPSLTTFKPIDYRPGDSSDPGAHVRFAQLRTTGVSIEFIEPVGGPSPWFDFVNARRDGHAAHHIAFTFGAQDKDFDTIVRHIQARGGRWRKGKRGVEGEKTGSSPEFEFLDTLGLVIEVTKAGG